MDGLTRRIYDAAKYCGNLEVFKRAQGAGRGIQYLSSSADQPIKFETTRVSKSVAQEAIILRCKRCRGYARVVVQVENVMLAYMAYGTECLGTATNLRNTLAPATFLLPSKTVLAHSYSR